MDVLGRLGGRELQSFGKVRKKRLQNTGKEIALIS